MNAKVYYEKFSKLNNRKNDFQYKHIFSKTLWVVRKIVLEYVTSSLILHVVIQLFHTWAVSFFVNKVNLLSLKNEKNPTDIIHF